MIYRKTETLYSFIEDPESKNWRILDRDTREYLGTILFRSDLEWEQRLKLKGKLIEACTGDYEATAGIVGPGDI